MNEYRSNATVEQIAERICSAKRILLTTHVKPDGDAIGSALALRRALDQKGHRHLHIRRLNAGSVAFDADFDVVIDDPFDGDEDFHRIFPCIFQYLWVVRGPV